jgi:hypothetical protein
MPAIEQHLHIHLFDAFALQILDGTGQAQAFFGAGLGGQGGD